MPITIWDRTILNYEWAVKWFSKCSCQNCFKFRQNVLAGLKINGGLSSKAHHFSLACRIWLKTRPCVCQRQKWQWERRSRAQTEMCARTFSMQTWLISCISLTCIFEHPMTIKLRQCSNWVCTTLCYWLLGKYFGSVQWVIMHWRRN